MTENLNPDHIRAGEVELSDEAVDRLLASVRSRQAKGLPTQVVHPWRTVARTVIQYIAGLTVAAVIWLLASIGVDVSALETELVTSLTAIFTLGAIAVVTKIMAHPRVEEFLAKRVPALATGVHSE